MSMRQGRPSSLDGIKRYAKAIKAEKGLQHARALDEAATLAGFQNFAHAKRALGSEGPRAPGRHIPPPPSQERPTTMPRSDFHIRARADWVRAVDALSGAAAPASMTWETRADIAKALAPFLGKNRNHAHLPGGGGMDIESVELSSETSCLDFVVGGHTAYRAKPRRMILERIQADVAESFLLIEFDELKPSGVYPAPAPADADDRPFPDEEVVDVGSGRLHPRSVFDDGEFPNGDPLPDDARLAVRLFRGKMLFVSKGSIWNGASATYDGRHARMGAAEIRSIIERVIERRAA